MEPDKQEQKSAPQSSWDTLGEQIFQGVIGIVSCLILFKILAWLGLSR